jgi:hypothetical protein
MASPDGPYGGMRCRGMATMRHTCMHEVPLTLM